MFGIRRDVWKIEHENWQQDTGMTESAYIRMEDKKK